jgi:heme/copper-type cytochrome/quinol oxidase subunit 3
MKQSKMIKDRTIQFGSNKNFFIGTLKQPFYVPVRSVWPFVTAWSLFFTMFSAVFYMHGNRLGVCIFSTTTYALFGSILCWMEELFYEMFEGRNTLIVRQNIRIGWSLFILSEAMLFFGFFWAFFHSSLSPAMEIGFVWPPKGIEVFNPWEVPLANTVILLSSGAFATWAHYMIAVSIRQAQLGLWSAICLGAIFTLFQIAEYSSAAFAIVDGIYGSLFYMITGFHGFHVLIGTVFLYVCVRNTYYGLLDSSSVFLDLAIWYWHFVDIIWLFVFAFIYCWGSGF